MQGISFDQLADALSEPVLVVSGDQLVLKINRAAADVLGRPASDVLGTRLSEWVGGSRSTSVPEFIGMCSRSRQPVFSGLRLGGSGHPGSASARCEGTLLEPAGPQRPAVILLRWRPANELSGRFLVLNEQIAALNREILHRRRSEADLFEQREWLRVVLASIGDAVVATDRDGRVRFLNPVAEALTGWSRDDAVGQPLVEVFRIINEYSRAAVDNPFQKVIQTGNIVGLANHTLLIHRDGSERPIEDSAAPIKDDRGNLLGVVLVFHDVTERKQLEREREALLAAERVARSDAERLNRVKDEFLATLSHELRTPLNAILGWAQILQGPNTTREDLVRGLDTISRNARAQTRLIEDLLDMSRIISGKLRLELQRVELAAVIRAAVDSVRPAADARSIALLERIEPGVDVLWGDPSRLQQIIWNLLSNSIKFTPKGGRVELCAERVGSQIEISVSDTGVGIDREFLPHLFERFRQADSSSTRAHGGLGLGLSIVKHLVELHGGSIRASSPGRGQGARFSFRLPIVAVRPQAAATAREDPSVIPSRPLAGIDLGGTCVLVVDDEADARLLVQRLLEDNGAIVLTAGSAAEALQLFEERRPDVILSDIGMPGGDGYQLIRSIRRLESRWGKVTPAAALTAFARSEDRTAAMLAGYQAHLAKPVDARELIVVVASLAGRTQPVRDA